MNRGLFCWLSLEHPKRLYFLNLNWNPYDKELKNPNRKQKLSSKNYKSSKHSHFHTSYFLSLILYNKGWFLHFYKLWKTSNTHCSSFQLVIYTYQCLRKKRKFQKSSHKVNHHSQLTIFSLSHYRFPNKKNPMKQSTSSFLIYDQQQTSQTHSTNHHWCL